jgi:PAS domain S-box-containing protein
MENKTKEELIKEIKLLQKRIAELERYESERKELDDKVIRRSVELAKTNVDLKDEIKKSKKAEEALRESERKIRALYDQTFQFIGLMKPDGTLIEANRTALEFSGTELSDVLNKPFWQTPWWTHSPELQEKLRQAIKKVAQGEFVRFEATHMAKDGTLHNVDFSLKPLKEENEKVIFMIPEGRDITERKKAEERGEELPL